MPKSVHPKVCMNCKHCEPFEINYDFEDEEIGRCSAHDDEVVYLDDDSYCADYHALKRPRVRAEDWYE